MRPNIKNIKTSVSWFVEKKYQRQTIFCKRIEQMPNSNVNAAALSNFWKTELHHHLNVSRFFSTVMGPGEMTLAQPRCFWLACHFLKTNCHSTKLKLLHMWRWQAFGSRQLKIRLLEHIIAEIFFCSAFCWGLCCTEFAKSSAWALDGFNFRSLLFLN